MNKIIFLSIISSGILLANGGMPPQTPPKEAISICKNKTEGTSCSVTTPRGDALEGTCTYTPDKKYFACKPENMGQPPKR